MIYHFLYPLTKYFFIFNVTRYITFRGMCAFGTSFLIVMFLWGLTIKRLKILKLTEKVNMYGHISLEALHSDKKGTPTMTGVLIIFSVLSSTMLWARLDNFFIWIVMAVLVLLGILGLSDDLLKVKTGKGLNRRQKLIGQIFCGALLGVIIVANKNLLTTLNFPFLKKAVIDLGYFYIFWVILMIVATSNAVNFTDGLDGLAAGGIVTNALVFAILAYVSGHIKFAGYLFIPYIAGAGELAVFCFSIGGAALAFLWFNSYPAEAFMGDAGALALGGVIGAVALLIKKEFLLFISGGLFVIEAMSVVLQIFSIRLRRKRIFRASPFHHHLQLLGWKEPKIIVRLWIISIVCALIALITLKLQ